MIGPNDMLEIPRLKFPPHLFSTFGRRKFMRITINSLPKYTVLHLRTPQYLYQSSRQSQITYYNLLNAV